MTDTPSKKDAPEVDLGRELATEKSPANSVEKPAADGKPAASAAVDDDVDGKSKAGKSDKIKNAFKKAGEATKAAGTKVWDVAKGQLTPRKIATRWLPVVGTPFLVAGIVDEIRGTASLLHKKPDGARTQFLPVAGNGHIDTPHGDASSSNSVDSMDRHLVEQNKALFNFTPDDVNSYCDQPCGNGCTEIAAGPFELDEDAAVIPVQNWADTLSNIHSQISAYQGEMWADRLLEKYGPGGAAEIPQLIEHTVVVTEALKEAVRSSEDMAKEAFLAFRESVRAGREEMQERANHEGSTWGWLGDMVTSNRGDGALDRLKSSTQRVHDAEKKNDEAVAKLNAALEAWTTTPAGTGSSTPLIPTSAPTTKPLADPGKPDTAPPLSTGAGGVGGAAPLTSEPEEDKDFMDALKDKLGYDPLASGMQSPFGGMPGGGDPFGAGGGLSPASNTSPFGEPVAPLSSSENPFEDDDADAKLEDSDDPFEDDDKDESIGEGEGGFKDDEPIIEKAGDGDTFPEGDTAPVVSEAGFAPAAASLAPDPNSPEARTVAMPDGREIVFPNAQTADMLRNLIAADPSAPTTIHQAADAAGFSLPPIGQDIGQIVPPSALQEGDLVVGEAGTGVYIGNGEVLMENQEVKPLAEVSVFNGEHQGLFRLEGTDGTMAASDPSAAPAQPVDGGATSPITGGSETAAAVAESGSMEAGGATGMPDEVTETASLSTEDTAVPGGVTDDPFGLDPNAAAF